MSFILDHNAAGVACPRFQCDKCGTLITDAHGSVTLGQQGLAAEQIDATVRAILLSQNN
jgi:hypothetical protein